MDRCFKSANKCSIKLERRIPAWVFRRQCFRVTITIDKIHMDFEVHFEGAWESSTVRERLYDGAATSVQFDVDSYRNHTPVAVEVKVSLYPDHREYGGKAYVQDTLLFLEPQFP